MLDFWLMVVFRMYLLHYLQYLLHLHSVSASLLPSTRPDLPARSFVVMFRPVRLP